MRLFLLLAALLSALPAAPLRFRITLDPAVAPNGASGRLFVFLSPGDEPRDRIRVGFVPENVSLAALEVPHWKPGAVVEFNPDTLAFPKPFSQSPKGSYAVMALLDPDHSFARDRQDAGDLVSPVAILKDLDPANAEPVPLVLNAVTPAAPVPTPIPGVEAVEFLSPSLSAFFGRPIHMRAGIVVPANRAPGVPLPAVYHIHGFGGSFRSAWSRGEALQAGMADGSLLKAVHVFLDANCPGGHHVFADSVNNGPWGRALTTELIPYLEKRFRLAPSPAGRFLTGHSSGGWSALWLQVRYPDFFGGAWPTSPDSVDFRNFTGIDVDNASNAYRTASGDPVNLVREDGRNVLTFEQFARMEAVTGEYGGQLASFEWVFSPRGPDGRPVPLFDRETGALNPAVREHWARYDIARLLRENWPRLGPKLHGRIRLVIGAEDNFRLNESAALLCSWLARKGREDACEIVPGRDHFNLFRPHETYKKGLLQRIDDEMRAKWLRSRRPPPQPQPQPR
jgi:hypothetical protein